MSGHVRADGSSIYLLHGWKDNEDEDVDVDGSGGSSEEAIQGRKTQADAVPNGPEKPATLNRAPRSAETSDQECDSLASKSRTQSIRTSENVEHIPNRSVVAKCNGGKEYPEESLRPRKNSNVEGHSRSQAKHFNAGKRLDARRFRDHFAAKLVGSRRSNIIQGNGREEVSSAMNSKGLVDSTSDPSKDMPIQQAVGKVINNTTIASEEPAVILHVNLEVEQEKNIHVPCNGDSNVASKESLQVFTRKRKQSSEGASLSERISDIDKNETDERSSDPKDSECAPDMQSESQRPNSIYGRSKRARKFNRQTDYIPWSDFGRFPAKKCEGNKSDVPVDNVAGTEVNPRQSGSKISSGNILEANTECNKEIRASSNVSSTRDMDMDDAVSQSNLGTILTAIDVEKEVGKEASANEDCSSCPAGKMREVFPESCIGILNVQGKDYCQDCEVEDAKVRGGTVNQSTPSNGTICPTKGGQTCRLKILTDDTQEDGSLLSDVNRIPDPKIETQLSRRTCGNASQSMREVSEVLDHSSFRQKSIQLPKSGTIGDHDSVCNKCKQGGQLICCDGKDCKVTFHIDCLDPPLRDIPPNDWYCPSCAFKRFFGGMHTVSKGIESIWDVKVEIGDLDSGGAPVEVGGGSLKQPEADLEARPNLLENRSPDPRCTEKSYFVKYKRVAHAHNQWLRRSQVSKDAPNVLINFEKQVEQGKAPKWDPEWSKPFRIIGKRKTMIANVSENFPCTNDNNAGHCIEWCVKWKNLGYEACTWEPADNTPLDSVYSKKLIMDYETRSAKARQLHEAKDTCKVECHSNLKIKSGMLADQSSLSEAIEKLINLWKQHSNSIAVNEIHQDRMKTAIGFLLFLNEEVSISRPCCVLVSPLLLGEWKAALRKWMPTINVVVYAGSKEARRVIQRYEFYNEDGFCMVQIVLTSFDILHLDIERLNELNFEALIIDECQRLKGTKTCNSLRRFSSVYRLLLLSEPIKNNVEDYQYIVKELSGEKEGPSFEENATLIELKTLVNKHIVQESKQESSGPTEFWVPVQMTRFQLEQYCKLLTENHDSLVRGKRGDIASSPQELLLKLRECCNHPFLVTPGYQESLTNLSAKELLDYGIGASGKLKFLDKMLGEARSSSKRVVIITQINLRAGKVSLMVVLDDYMRQQFGIDSYERLDGGVQTGKKSAAVQRFNAPNSKCFVFLLDRRACASSVKLQAIDCIIIFDSDWNPQTDIQSLLRMYSPGELEHVAICRFYCTQTIEERVLISARKHSDLDSYQHNFTLAACQKMFRWGASKNLERFDKFSRDKLMSAETVMYTSEVINHFLGKGAVQSDELGASNSLFKTALFPRCVGDYSKGVPLYGEDDKALAEEEGVSATEFWMDLLKDRQVEASDVQVRELRTRKKVQYLEDSFDVSNPSQILVDEEEESRRKRRKIVDVSELSNLQKGGRAPSVERSPVGVDGENQGAVKMEWLMTNKVDNLEKAASQQLKTGSVDVGHSPSGMDNRHATKTSVENTKPVGNLETAVNETALNDPAAAAKSEQQQILLIMKSDLEKLCQALQFQADTAEHVEQLLFSVGNFFKLPKERSLLHAIELSLCWLAAEQQHYCIDRRATLALAESCFGVQLDKIETVYAKLEERWKKRLQQGAQQLQETRTQEKNSIHVGEQDRTGRTVDQELHIDKDGLNQIPTNLGSVEDSGMVGEESSALRDMQLPKQGPVISLTRDPNQNSCPLEAQTSSMVLEEQVPVEQAGTSAKSQDTAPLDSPTDVNRISLSQQQRNERSHLISTQKIQLGSLEQLERKYKNKLKQQYSLAIAKLSRTSSSSEGQSKLLEACKIAFKTLTSSFRDIRANLIKHQNEERGKEHRSSSEHLGRSESLNRADDYSEESIFISLPQWLRTTIDTGDFQSVRALSGLDGANGTPLNAVNASSTISIASVPPSPHSQSTSSLLISGASASAHPSQKLVSDSQSHVVSYPQQQMLGQQERQVHDSLLQQQEMLSTVANDPNYPQVVPSPTVQSLQRQHPLLQQQPFRQQQRSTAIPAQPVLTSTRPSSPIPLSQQPSLSQAPSFPQHSQSTAETQQSLLLQRVSQAPSNYGQPTTGSSLTPTRPNDVAPVSLSGTYGAPHSSVRPSSYAAVAPSRILPSSQPRSSQQYHSDPLAQEFLRLRKEQDKLKTSHESEKERIKSQFMRELELLSKRYEVMLQEEEAIYTQKSSALESNLKKVEMNRRLAEVFRLKNAQDKTAVNSGTAGQEVRSGVSQGQSYQQYQSLMVGRAPLVNVTSGCPQTSAIMTGPLSERHARTSASSIMGAQVAGVGALTNSSRHFSQSLTSSFVGGHSPQSVNLVSSGANQLRSTLGAPVQGSHIEPFRASAQLSPVINAGVQRLSAPLANPLLNNATLSVCMASTPQMHDSQGWNGVPVPNYAMGLLNHSSGASHSGAPTTIVPPNTTSASTQYNASVAASILVAPATQSPATAQQEGHLSWETSARMYEIPRYEIERLTYDNFTCESVGPILADNGELQAVDSRYTTPPIQVSHGCSNEEAPIATLKTFNVQNHVINGLGSTHSQHFSDGQDPGLSHVICLSDDD